MEEFTFSVTITRDDVAGVIGDKAYEMTDKMMQELVGRLKKDYMNQLYSDSLDVIVDEIFLPQLE